MSKLLSEIKQELVKKQVQIKDKISVDEETNMALEFFKEQGVSTSEIIREALGSWRRKGVVNLANNIKKEIENNTKKEEKTKDLDNE